MYSVVALSAYQYALNQLRSAKVFFESGAPVHFFWNEVMKSQVRTTIAARADTGIGCHNVLPSDRIPVAMSEEKSVIARTILLR